MKRATHLLRRHHWLRSKALQVPSECFCKYGMPPLARNKISGPMTSSNHFLILPMSNSTLMTHSFASPSRFISHYQPIHLKQLTRLYVRASRCAIQIARCSHLTKSDIDSRHSPAFSQSTSTCVLIPALHSPVHSPSSQNAPSVMSLAIVTMDLPQDANSSHCLLAHNYRPSGVTR